MFSKRFWADAGERAIRGALVVFLTILLVDGSTSADADWRQKFVGAGIGAAVSFGLSLLSALKSTENASFVLSEAPGEGEPPAPPNS